MFKYILLIAPLITGLITSGICHMNKNSGSVVKFRPAPLVFSAWFILYILIGYAWVNTTIDSKKYKPTHHIPFIILTVLLVSWLVVYGCLGKKKEAVLILTMSIMATFACFAISNVNGKVALSPLLGWLILALIMNSTEVQYT